MRRFDVEIENLSGYKRWHHVIPFTLGDSTMSIGPERLFPEHPEFAQSVAELAEPVDVREIREFASILHSEARRVRNLAKRMEAEGIDTVWMLSDLDECIDRVFSFGNQLHAILRTTKRD
jgi:hypothetical protein